MPMNYVPVWLQATNGADPSRRLNMLGFCRSVNDLSEVVEDAVLSRGGKIVVNQIELKRCVPAAVLCLL